MNRSRPVRSGALAAVASLIAATAWAQGDDAPEFPASLSPADVTAWMKRNTDLDPASVTAVTPSAVTGVLSSISTPQGPTIRQVNLRSESLSRAAYQQDHVLSWTSVVEVDCKTRKARLGRTMAYGQRNLIGDGRETVAASPAWVTPLVGGPAYNVMLKVCDGKTINPLTGQGVRLAAAPPPKAEAAARAPRTEAAKPAAPPSTPKPAPAAPKAAARPAPVPPKPVAPAPPKPAAGVSTKPSVAAAPKPATPAAAATPGAVTVQAAAASSDADARRLLATLQRRAAPPAGVTPRVVKAVVGGKTYYRLQFAGFRTAAEAHAYCKAAGADGCLVRSGKGD